MKSVHIIDNQHFVCEGETFDQKKVLHVGTKGSVALFLKNPEHPMFGIGAPAVDSPEVAELKKQLAASEAALAAKSQG